MPDDAADLPDPREVLLTLPARWPRTSDPEAGVLVAARSASVPPSGVRPEIVLRCEPVDERDVQDWQRRVVADLGRRLTDLAIEDDDEHVDDDGVRVLYLRYAHRTTGPTGLRGRPGGTLDVVVDHWARLVDGLGVTLSCAAAREDYLVHSDVFEAVAATVEVVVAAPV